MNNTVSNSVFSTLSKTDVNEISTQLNLLLANYHLHYQKLRNFHWNVYGEHFFELHQQFENMYNLARTAIDEIAERILTLHSRPVSNFSDYLYMSSIQEEKESLKPTDMVEAILRDLDLMIPMMTESIEVAEKAGDPATADMIIGYQKDLQKFHWMFRAFLRNTMMTS